MTSDPKLREQALLWKINGIPTIQAALSFSKSLIDHLMLRVAQMLGAFALIVGLPVLLVIWWTRRRGP
jgi:hypothetical protein